MSHRILAEIDRDITMIPGDIITVSSTFNKKRYVHVSYEIEKVADCNTVKIIEFENELGLKSGVAGVFGNA